VDLCVNSPEARAVLAQGVQDGVGDVAAARHTKRLQAVTTPADCDEALICDLLLTESSLCVHVCGRTLTLKYNVNAHKLFSCSPEAVHQKQSMYNFGTQYIHGLNTQLMKAPSSFPPSCIFCF